MSGLAGFAGRPQGKTIVANLFPGTSQTRYVTIRNVQHSFAQDIYVYFLQISWSLFWFYFLVMILFMSFIFAQIYWFFGGSDGFIDSAGGNDSDPINWWDIFFFSVSMSSTFGLSKAVPHPNSFATTAIGNIQSLCVQVLFACLTGIIFARFARPACPILLANNLVFVNFQGVQNLQTRLVVACDPPDLLDTTISITYGRLVHLANGSSFRELLELNLERPHFSILRFSSILRHRITEDSPLFGKSLEDLKLEDAFFTVSVSALEPTSLQNVTLVKMYTNSEIVRGTFVDLVRGRDSNGHMVIDHQYLHDLIIDE
jgi:inward rectifier potassium channel